KERLRWIDQIVHLIDGATDEITLPDVLLDDFAATARSYWKLDVPLSAGYYGQLMVGPTGETSFVLNQVVSGYGAYFARACDEQASGPAFAALAGSVRRLLAKASKHSQFVQILGTFGLNVQLQPLLTEWGIVYPGESAGDAAGSAISWSDLAVRFDSVSGS